MPSNDYHEHVYIEDIEDLIKKIIKKINRPYPEDLTDQVFFDIETNPEMLRRYKLFAGDNTHTANSMIGKFVKEYTGLKVKGTCKNPKSSLIKSYTKLGY
jgi:hypothetical protein